MIKKTSEDEKRGPEFVAALARGLNVLTAFGRSPRRMTLSQVAEATDLSRGTARRFLLTLQELNFVGSDGKLFWLTPKVLQFSGAYLSTFGLTEAGRTAIRSLTEKIGESSSMAVLDGHDVVYVARVETRRIFSSGLEVGSRLPAFCSSLGRVLLAGLSDEELDYWLAEDRFTPQSPRTITDPTKVRQKVQEARRLQYAIIDGEMEVGVRSIAVPICDRAGHTIAALNIGTSAARASLDHMRKVLLPALRQAASEVERTLGIWQRS
ncbi:MAG: IclR family transcriptional regulator C-terminal domain-containing protein [Bradyrhizobium sp.]|uniref:IclR family transcriptional regulator domain-containing protein n=1 Tax=Bradyrhizobium sp. TaxID=376 RepID=UPI0029B6F348|nr:IclR family transcriptional regulator C-terminal domain-containing protein [Bradyrhizobium sp.]MDX3969190.1 IclR family transcriptional regulator C-terminal domain-containing protein [Bradyrhizobium sp.]